jgi:DVNP family
MTVGSRAQVFHGTADKTSGGLTKKDLMMNKHHRIVSKKKHTSAKKKNRLLEHGYGYKKGQFGTVHLNKSRKLRKSKKSRSMYGGSGGLTPLGYAHIGKESTSGENYSLPVGSGISGAGITNTGGFSTDVQMRAGMTGGKRRKRSFKRGGSHALNPASLSYNMSMPQNGGTSKASSMGLGFPFSSPQTLALNAA